MSEPERKALVRSIYYRKVGMVARSYKCRLSAEVDGSSLLSGP